MHFKLKKSSQREKKIFFVAVAGILTLTAIVLASSWYVHCKTQPFLYSSTATVPYNDVALVLGTSRTAGKLKNDYFYYRIESAIALYKKGKVKYLLVSGTADPARHYDEITDMTNALRERGIPQAAILSDNSGHRTLDSIVRAKELIGLKKFTIISQETHNARAVYIARYYGMDVVGFNAGDCDLLFPQSRFELREGFAKVKMLLDLYVLKTRPAESHRTGIAIPATCISVGK
ncbi:MAG: SanA/YdcF family protein [Victivallaceae bacterium]